MAVKQFSINQISNEADRKKLLDAPKSDYPRSNKVSLAVAWPSPTQDN